MSDILLQSFPTFSAGACVEAACEMWATRLHSSQLLELRYTLYALTSLVLSPGCCVCYMHGAIAFWSRCNCFEPPWLSANQSRSAESTLDSEPVAMQPLHVFRPLLRQAVRILEALYGTLPNPRTERRQLCTQRDCGGTDNACSRK